MNNILQEIKINKKPEELKNKSEHNDPEIQLELTKSILIGHGVKKDIDKSKKLFERLLESNNEKVLREACYILGRCYLEEIYPDNQNTVKGMDLIKKSASYNNEDALLFLANSYFHGVNGLKKDIDLADKNIRKLANNGNYQAQLKLGQMYETGFDIIEPDINEAIRWYEEAAKGKVPEAFNRLGYIYFYGNEEAEPDYEKSLEKWRNELKIKYNEETKKMIAMSHLKIAEILMSNLKNKSTNIKEIEMVLKNINQL